MSEKVYSEFGKLIIELLSNFERFQYTSTYDKADNQNALYLLYSSTLKIINRVIYQEKRNARFFRLKYHHILSNESVDEYLFHCLSKILSDLMEVENNYQRFIQPVADLHMKLMSILTRVQLEHEPVVRANRSVRLEVNKRLDKKEHQLNEEQLKSDNNELNKCFNPVYFLPPNHSNKKLKKTQTLTFQAIHHYYFKNTSLSEELVDMLLDFDNDFAEFELDFVCQVNKNSIFTTTRAELTMDVAVMFSEAVKWAHDMNLLQYKPIGDCDIEIMVGIPRLSVLFGCGVAYHGPLSEWALNCRNEGEAEERLAPVFQDHRSELFRLRRQLNVLDISDICYLGKLLLDHQGLPVIPSSCGGTNRLVEIKQLDENYIIHGDMHALFKLVSSVSDQMQSKHASDYRFFMETIFKLYKDETDSINSDSSSILSDFSKSNSKSFNSCDLFSTQYQNVLSFISHINQPVDEGVDEAIDALTYSASNQFVDDNYLDLAFPTPWDSKTCPSPIRVNKQFPSHQISALIQNPPQALDSHLQFDRPQWRSDSSFSRCCHCEKNFNVFRRRHHCRRCGYLFCSACWGTKLSLPIFGIQSRVSICIECEEFLKVKVLPPTPAKSSS